jgi:hypothetical protein
MTEETLEKDITAATVSLLEMARVVSWNTISNNCVFILTEIKNIDGENFFDTRKRRKKANDVKKPLPLTNLLPLLTELYTYMYDINLYVYRAWKKYTVIEMAYYPKSALDNDFRQTVMNNNPMLHARVALPLYHEDKKEKFNINWEHNTPGHRWKMFHWNRKAKKLLLSRPAPSKSSK